MSYPRSTALMPVAKRTPGTALVRLRDVGGRPGTLVRVRRSQLGALPVAAVPAVAKVVGGIFAKSDPEKDRGRIARYQEAARRAIGGDVPAAMYVRWSTGHFGAREVPGYGRVDKNSTGSAAARTVVRQLWATIKRENPAVAARAQGGDLTSTPQLPAPQTQPRALPPSSNSSGGVVVQPDGGIVVEPTSVTTTPVTTAGVVPTDNKLLLGLLALGVAGAIAVQATTRPRRRGRR